MYRSPLSMERHHCEYQKDNYELFCIFSVNVVLWVYRFTEERYISIELNVIHVVGNPLRKYKQRPL
jgi:hypothetical protein